MTDNVKTIINSVYMRKRSSVMSIFLHAGITFVEAEDMTQDVFVRLMGVDVLNPDTADAMAIKIAFNLKTDYFRKRRPHSVPMQAIFEMEDRHRTPLTDMFVMDIVRFEDAAVKTLPPMQAKAYTLSRRNNMSMQEISDIMGLTLRTAENHLYLSRRKVRNILSKVL